MIAELPRVPLSVVGGYLGAGKTTLINRLLMRHRDTRLAVLVNDFGAINIDAALLRSATEDTLELTNGCVCCAMSGDLFFAIGDLLDRRPRPDHILVEASGIADPARIAAVALAEPELRYSGIVTVVDGVNIESQLDDERIARQVEDQLLCADLLAISKTGASEANVVRALRNRGLKRWIGADDPDVVAASLFGSDGTAPSPGDHPHPPYVQWSDPAPIALTRHEIDARLNDLPEGLLRCKAIVPDTGGGFWEVHVVGRRHEVGTRPDSGRIGVTAIGLAGSVSLETLENWWNASRPLSGPILRKSS